jgi:hypothetical protein
MEIIKTLRIRCCDIRVGKEGLLFEKRSKNFCTAAADYPATAVHKFFGSFFEKRTASFYLVRPTV